VIVLDSSAIVAYHNARDVHHPAAAELMAEVVAGSWGRALLLEYVLLEVATVLLARRGLDVAARAVTGLLESREIEFIPCSALFSDVLETFLHQERAALSFTDAAIVVVARQMRAAVATFDADLRAVPGIIALPQDR
jgi:predicted nucleic acid-binding protein